MALAKKDGSARAATLAAKGKYKSALSVYLKLGDHQGAAQMYEKLGRTEPAAEEYTQAGDFMSGAELLAALGRTEDAASMFAKAGAFERGAELLIEAKKLKEAARMLERGGAHTRAAELFEEAGLLDHAARMFETGGRPEDAIRVHLANNKKELAARLCIETGDHARAAEIYDGMKVYRAAAECYVNAGNKELAVDAFEKAGAVSEAIALCEELGLLHRAAEYHEKLGNKARAAELYRDAGQFAAAGRIFESDYRFYDAAKMYEQDEDGAAQAAQLYHSTYSTEMAWRYETKFPVRDVALAEEGERIVLGLAGPEVLLLDKDGNLLWRFRMPMDIPPRSVAITSDGDRIAVGTEGRSVYLLDSSKNMLWKREFGGEVRGVVLQEEDGGVIAGCADNRIRALTEEGKDRWTVETGYKVWHLEGHQKQRIVLAGCGDSHLYLLDFAGKLLWKENAGSWITRVALSPDGRHAAAVLGLNLLNLYDLEKRALLWQYKHPSVLQDCEFWRDERLIVGSNSGSFMIDFEQKRLWRDATQDRVTRIAASEDAQTVLLGHFDEGLAVVRLNDCMLRAARNYARCGEFTQAASLYESKNELTNAVEMYTRAETFDRAAALADKLENTEGAAELYEKAGLFKEAGLRYEQSNQIERAAECYTAAGDTHKAGELMAQFGDTLKAAELHLTSGDFSAAGTLFEKAGAADRALSAYEQAVDAGSLTTEGTVGLGRLYLAGGRADDAIKLVQPVARDAEFGIEGVNLLAECFVNKGQFDLAADRYREALGGDDEVDEKNIDLFYGLGCAYEQGGLYDKAREVYQKILVIDYYYKDVTGRLAHIGEMSSVFSAAASTGAATAPTIAGAQATVAGARQNRYDILRQLGEGGMGVVYLARDTKLDREVALKVLPSKFSNNDEFRTRFVREARAVAALNHKNVVAVYDIGEEMGESFIAMEYIEGKSLREIQSARKSLPVAETVDLAKQIAEGLGAAHRRGIVHRDIKPENIMVVDETNEVKIMDFGLARIEEDPALTQEGSVMGTWRYMAPEQVQGQRAGAPADIYATGVVLHELVTGEPLFSEGDLGFHHVNTVPPPLTELVPDTPRALSDVVAKCLEKDAADRYADGDDLRSALQGVG